jgi:phage tail sheath protein FI
MLSNFIYNLKQFIMKINFLQLRTIIPIIITGIILSSCSKDKTATPEANLTGTWTSGSTTYTAMVGTRTLNQYFTEVVGLTADQAELLITTYSASIQQSFTGTIQLKSDKTYTSNIGGKTDAGTWSLSADAKKLTITSNTSGPEILDVLVLTASKLQLQLLEILNQDLNGDGVPESINVNLDVSFTK